MSNVSEWSTTAGSNNGAPPDGAPENMLPGKVNDCMREMMAALAKWFQDSNGTLTAAGGTTAFTLTTNSSHAALSDIPLLVFRMNAANTGTVTLNVDGLGAKPWRKSAALEDYASGELASGQIVVVAYNSGNDDFFTIGPVTDGFFAAGVDMVFYEASAPTGWTAVAQNNKALRVVSAGGTGGTAGGTTAFTSVFTSRTIAQANLPSYNLSHTLTLPNHIHSDTFALPNHVHSAGSYAADSDGAHTHGYTDRGDSTASVAGGGNSVANDTDGSYTTDSGGAHTHTISGSSGNPTTLPSIDGAVGNPTTNPAIDGTVPLGGSGTAMDFAVQYVDVIIATKD